MSGQESSQPEAGPSTPRIPPRLPPSNAQAGPSTSKGKTSKRKRAGGRYSVSAAEATDALSRRVNAEKCWEVAKMPGIMTCGELDQWGLAIASDWNLLACTLCSKADRLVDFTKVREHLKFHFPQLSPSTTTRQIKDVCRKYGALDKAPAEIETPRHGGAPLEMLQRYQLWKCTVCEDQEIDTYTASDRSKRRHHSEVHGNQDPDHDRVNRVVWAQTFYREKAENKKWFEVDPGALHIPKIDIDHAFKSSPDREATAEEMLRAYNALWTPLQHAPVQVDELRDVMPLLHVTGVAQHAGNRTLDLRPLVQKDGPSNTGYQWIYNVAYDQWIEDQPRITDVPDWEKRALLDDESGKASSMFVPLAPDTSPNYGDLWGRWCMFICYLRDLAKNGNDPYVVPMTTEQKRWADQALLYCAGNNEHQYHAKDILYNLSAAFWRPTHAGYFDSLAKDKFSDPTVRFACLINIRESGEFSSPSNMCHELVRMKYIMRQVLYFWSEQDHEIAGRPMTGIVDAISHALSRRRVSPFAVICSWAAHAASYTHTTVALPSVSWTSDTSLSVHGYQISVPHLGDAIAAEVRALDKIINENLLLGLPPEELGFNVTESTPIVDDLGDTAVDYSMFKDKNLDLEKRLYQAFSVYPQADHLINRIGINDDPARVFKYAGCAKWLETVNLVNRKILLLLHLTGGQSGRGAELVRIRYMNTSTRRRSLYMVAPGLMAMILFYSKMTSQTGKDRVIGHAVPWCLARLILIHRALVLPLASMMKSRMSTNTNLRTNMLSLVCMVNGEPVKADFVGNDLQKWFIELCGNPIRFRSWRHLQIAVSRKLMPGAYRTLQRMLNLLDAQAGHSTAIADEHYAVEGSNEWKIEHDTLYKYIIVSSWWWRIIFKNDPDMLTDREVRIGQQAANDFPSLDDADPESLPHTAPQLTQALVSLDDRMKNIAAEVREVRNLVLDIPNQVARLVEKALNEGKHLPLRPMPSATRASKQPVQAIHLLALQLFCGLYEEGPDRVVWTSAQQAQGLIYTLERDHSMLVVLPTGGGKSALFGAMQYMHRGVTIVILPLKALLADQLASSARRDPERPYHLYRRDLDITHGVVVVQMEQVNRDFLAWCQALRGRHALARIVVDECHLVLLHSEFRACMQNVKPLIEAGVPLVCLTATLPPSLEEELRTSVGGPTWKIIRAPTQRRNLRLRFARYRSEDDGWAALAEVLRRYNVKTMPRKSGILIIVPYTELADEVGKRFNIPVYHGRRADGQVVLDWIAGKFMIIVGTTGLGTGVHHDHCLLVIHFGLPYGILSYWQECGRAGRSGEAAMCLTIWWGAVRKPKGDDYQGQVALNNMLNSIDCRRERISAFVDGSDLVTTCFDGLDYCDRCVIKMQRARASIGLGLTEELIHDYGIEPMPRGVLPARLLEFPSPEAAYSQPDRYVPASSPVLGPSQVNAPIVPEVFDEEMETYGDDMDYNVEMQHSISPPVSQAPQSPRSLSPRSPMSFASRASIARSISPAMSNAAMSDRRAEQPETGSLEHDGFQVVQRRTARGSQRETPMAAGPTASSSRPASTAAGQYVSPEPPSPTASDMEGLHPVYRTLFTVADAIPDVIPTHSRSRSVSGPPRQTVASATHRRASSSTAAVNRASTSADPFPSIASTLDQLVTPTVGHAPRIGVPARATSHPLAPSGAQPGSRSAGRSSASHGPRPSRPSVADIPEEEFPPIPAPNTPPRRLGYKLS